MKKYYKVVTEKLQSIIALNPIEYKINKWVFTSDNTYLFVFDSIEDAEYCIKLNDWNHSGAVIYECECHGITKYDDLHQLVWKPEGISEPNLKRTIFAKGVKLTSIVKKCDVFCYTNDIFWYQDEKLKIIKINENNVTLFAYSSHELWDWGKSTIPLNDKGYTIKDIKILLDRPYLANSSLKFGE